MKTYNDNSGLDLITAKEYAEQLAARNVTFQDFSRQWANLAASEWGQDVKAEMEILSIDSVGK